MGETDGLKTGLNGHGSDTEETDWEREERVLVFMESMAPQTTPFLHQLEKEALADAVPVIRPQTRSLIQFLMLAAKPRRILEVGTGTGFSACLMLTYAPEDAVITTIERDQERIRRAQENFRSTAGRIRLLEGDAADILPSLEGSFDFIFMDAAKGQYIHFLPEILRLLPEGGLLLSDNIFKEGEILESRYAVKRRNRTIHKRMRDYLHSLTHDPALQTLLLQEGDGAALTLKKTSGMPADHADREGMEGEPGRT